MKNLIISSLTLLLPSAFCLLPSLGADFQITAVLTVTNNPAFQTNYPGTNALVLTAGTNHVRWWATNLTNASLQLRLTNDVASSRTNLLAHLNTYPISVLWSATYNTTNSSAVNLRAPLNTNFTATFAGIGATNWGHVSYFTNTLNIAAPILTQTNAMAPNERTNAANAIVNLLAAQDTSNAVPATHKGFTNFVNLAAAQTLGQKLITNSQISHSSISNSALTNVTGYFTNATLTNAQIVGSQISNSTLSNSTAISLSGTVSKLTNGYWTNAVLDAPTFTNAVNRGNAFSSPGDNSLSDQFGSSAVALGIGALAVGTGSAATNLSTTAIGVGAKAYKSRATALGQSAQAQETNTIAIGTFARATAVDAVALGVDADATHQNTIVIGNYAASTGSNRVEIGSATQTFYVPGLSHLAGGLTNLATVADSTTTLRGSLITPAAGYATLANGNNAGIILGTNFSTKLSGATTIATLCGFAAGASDEWHLIRLSGAVTNLIANDSGVDPTPANRILTGTGGDLTLTNNPAFIQVIYDTAVARWRVLNHSR